VVDAWIGLYCSCVMLKFEPRFESESMVNSLGYHPQPFWWAGGPVSVLLIRSSPCLRSATPLFCRLEPAFRTIWPGIYCHSPSQGVPKIIGYITAMPLEEDEISVHTWWLLKKQKRIFLGRDRYIAFG